MIRFLAFLGTVVLLLGLLVGWVLEPGHVPLLDANRTRLAETYKEGFVSGFVFARTSGRGSADMVEETRQNYASLVDDFDPQAVIPAFCGGLVAGGFAIEISNCTDIMRDNQYWPTYDGALTWAWNAAYPWPGGPLVTVHTGEESGRTGGREGFERLP